MADLYKHTVYSFVDNLKKVMAEYKISQNDLAKYTGLSKNTISSYFKDDNPNAPWEILAKIVDCINLRAYRLRLEEDKKHDVAKAKGKNYKRKFKKQYSLEQLFTITYQQLLAVPPIVITTDDENLKPIEDIKDYGQIDIFLKMLHSPIFMVLLNRIVKYNNSNWDEPNSTKPRRQRQGEDTKKYNEEMNRIRLIISNFLFNKHNRKITEALTLLLWDIFPKDLSQKGYLAHKIYSGASAYDNETYDLIHQTLTQEEAKLIEKLLASGRYKTSLEEFNT